MKTTATKKIKVISKENSKNIKGGFPHLAQLMDDVVAIPSNRVDQ